jgi:signal transduction histidine kinase
MMPIAFGWASGRVSVWRRGASWLAVPGIAVCGLAVVVATAGVPGDQAFGRGLLELLVIGVPMAAGIYTLRTPLDARFGVALLVLSVSWSLTALSETSASVPYTIGRLTAFLVPLSVYYLLLVFPDGRCARGFDRALRGAVFALAAVFFFGTAFFVEAFPVHTPWATCVTDCPDNALFVLNRQPAVMADVVIPLREYLLIAVLAGLSASMIRRWRAASRLRRRVMGPVVAVGIAMAACQTAFYVARQADAGATVVDTLGAVWGVCVVGVAVAFLLALFRRRLLLADVLARLSSAVRDQPDAAQLRDALAAALGDPTVELLLWDETSGAWRDHVGRGLPGPPTAPPGRVVAPLGERDGSPGIAVIHDAALCDDTELVRAVSSLALAGWRHGRVVAGLATATAELNESRQRIAETADLERARIERDLHDGAQQRLIALRVRLSLAGDQLHDDPAAAADAVRELAVEAEGALQELRAVAQGVYPSILKDYGLEAALRAVAQRASIPVHVSAAGVERHPVDVESAVYFVCVEAVQNAMKHASTATGVWIDVSDDDGVRFEVRDDGSGFVPDGKRHGGLANMRDRMEVVGGRLTIDSAPGDGTRIVGRVMPSLATAAGVLLHAERPRDSAHPTSGTSDLRDVLLYERLLLAVPASVSRIRRELDDVLARSGVTVAQRSDIAVTVTEAATNVVLHAYRDAPGGPLYVAAALHVRALVVSVIDDGCGMRPRPDSPGAGLGLALMSRLADELQITSGRSDSGTAVHARFEDVAPAPATPLGRTAAPADGDGQVLSAYLDGVGAIPDGAQPDSHGAAGREAERTLARARERRAAALRPEPRRR